LAQSGRRRRRHQHRLDPAGRLDRRRHRLADPGEEPLGPLLDFAYTGEVLLPVPISVPAGAQVGSTVTLKADAAFLVCEQVCVPEDAVVTLTLPVVAGAPAADPKWGAASPRPWPRRPSRPA
jgi:DsbC/DsbD-like thiol-disulfide interchange protein